MSDRPRIAVVTFPGSNDDGDALLALEHLGAAPVGCWHADPALPDGTEGVVLPGGFSYGDYLRCGAIARFAPVMEDVARFVAAGGPVIGICNGFQILCEAGLLPGVLRPNRQQEFVCRDVTVTVESTASVFAGSWELGQELVIPIKHGEGSWYGDPELVALLEARSQIAFRYDRRPERRGRPDRRGHERGRQRARPDAAPRARGRPAPRADGRSGCARRAARGGPRGGSRSLTRAQTFRAGVDLEAAFGRTMDELAELG